MAMIAGFAALAVIADGTERLQIVRSQTQVPVVRQRLDVIDVHARAVSGRAPAEDAGRLFSKVCIAQICPCPCLVKPFHEARRRPLAANEGAQQPG